MRQGQREFGPDLMMEAKGEPLRSSSLELHLELGLQSPFVDAVPDERRRVADGASRQGAHSPDGVELLRSVDHSQSSHVFIRVVDPSARVFAL